jgi:GNAT superfamily N-acetyltransferase
MVTPMIDGLKILAYKPEDQQWFEKLNRQWIEKYFSMEPLDFQILLKPEEHIINEGGSIFMAFHDNVAVGTVALKRISASVYELTKMAVDENFQGKKIGRALAGAAIEKATEAGAGKVILYSNTILKSAIALYINMGFREIPVDGPYKRTNIKMQLILR